MLFNINYMCTFSSCVYKGVEKNNDDVRIFHLTKSNKWDAPKDILLVSKRLQFTSQHELEPRVYKKRNGEYWSTDRDQRSKKQTKKVV